MRTTQKFLTPRSFRIMKASTQAVQLELEVSEPGKTPYCRVLWVGRKSCVLDRAANSVKLCPEFTAKNHVVV